MPSTLSWIDYDQTARERTLRILSLFHERDSRDELGLGGIRDSFADQFFPGTSAIQTRLRYMLFIPWIFKRLEEKQIPPPDFAIQAEKIERSLTKPLLETDDQSGVFGKTAGQQLKRLPSSVYWYGLGSWEIRNLEITQDQYHRQIGLIYKKRHKVRRLYKEDKDYGDDRDRVPPSETVTWHPRLPRAPKGFPEKVDFQLTREEAEFILERITRSHPDSLLAHLAMHCDLTDVEAPWLHPDWASFRADHKKLLSHARSMGHGHTITTATRRFIETWIHLVIGRANKISDDETARHLIEMRERTLKGPRSRFINRRAPEQWALTLT